METSPEAGWGDEREAQKEGDVCTHTADSLAAQQKQTQLCKAATLKYIKTFLEVCQQQQKNCMPTFILISA